MKLLFLLLVSCFVSFADCSQHIGSVQINELFVGQDDKSSSANWVELKLNKSDTNLTSWQLQISQSDKVNQTIAIDSTSFEANGNYLTTTVPIRLSRNSSEQTNVALFDEAGRGVDSITIFGKGGDSGYRAENIECSQLDSGDLSVSAFADGSTQTYFDDIERINDGKIWIAWKNLSSKNSTNIAINDTGTYAKEHTMQIYNTARKTLRTVVAGESFQVVVQTSTDLVNSNRIVALGSDDGCVNANVNLSCTQATLKNNALSTTLECMAPNSAYKNVRIKVLDGRTESCSSDSFAIRPANIAIEAVTEVRAGEESIKTTAVGSNGTVTSNYDSQLRLDAVINKTSCPVVEPLKDKQLEVRDGSGLFGVDEVGDMNITARDSSFAMVDLDGDCVNGSATNTPSADGLVGCDVFGSASVAVLPFAFDISQSISNQSGNRYTYRYGGDLDKMSAKISFDIKAVSKNGATTKNFSQGCYEEPIKISPSVAGVDEYDAVALFANPFEEYNLCDFDNGSCQVLVDSNKAIRLNFKKPLSPKNPLSIKVGQIKLEITDANGTKIRNIEVDDNKTALFVYGKSGVVYGAGIVRLEALFYDANTTRALASGLLKSSDSGDFWVNDEDNYSYFYIKQDGEFITPKATSVLKLSNQSGYLINGSAQMTVANDTGVYQKLKLHINVPAYLWDKERFSFDIGSSCSNHPCQNMELFSSLSSWFGQGRAVNQKAIDKLPKGKRKESK